MIDEFYARLDEHNLGQENWKMNQTPIILTPIEAYLIADAFHSNWMKRALYAEFKVIMDKLYKAGNIPVRIYKLDGSYEDKVFNSVSELLDYKSTLPPYTMKVMDGGMVAITLRK